MEQQPVNIRRQQLAKKWLNGTISPEEEKEFAQWYNHFDDTAELLLNQSFAGSNDELKQRIFAAIDKEIIKKTAPVHRIHFLRRGWFRLVAASVVAGVLFCSAYIYYTRLVPARLGIHIQPGGNKAILTLGNGKTILLQQLGNSILPQSDTNVRITMADGYITYLPPTTPFAGDSAVYNTLSTPKGGKYRIGLPDGTQAWLNSASSIKYPTAFTGAQRVVQITGEVYFEVAKNKKKPFRVKTSQATVEVLGTHFTISDYADEQKHKITLLEGSIKIEENNNRQATLLIPGQQAILSMALPMQVSIADTAQSIAWKTGFFEFGNTELPEIMRQIGRWYNIEIVVESNSLKEKFGGRISKNLPLEDVLKMLEASGVTFRMEEGKLRVGS